MNKKIVFSLTKFTTTDFVDHLSCIVWFTKCNMRCQYCYNDNIVFAKEGSYTCNDILKFLQKRVGLLDSVVLSGGEALGHDLTSFCKEIKALGFKIKLDTNGTNTKALINLIENDLIDYIALDFKAPDYKYQQITQSNLYKDFLESLTYLIHTKQKFEVRTTVHNDLLNIYDLNWMINLLYSLEYTNTYYLQRFLETPTNIGDIMQSEERMDFSKLHHQKLKIEIRN